MPLDLRDPLIDSATVCRVLDLAPHPEGGHYREVWRDDPPEGGRGAATSILFLLARGDWSRWHRVDAAEVWLWHAGAALALDVAPEGAGVQTLRLGPDLGAGETPQATVPANAWQQAASTGEWTLVSCVVAPAFSFAGFTLAPPGWRPAR